jgi:hypothetical protein
LGLVSPIPVFKSDKTPNNWILRQKTIPIFASKNRDSIKKVKIENWLKMAKIDQKMGFFC